ncbi:DUF4440 domain-containing protein [Pedobacter sp. MC2016-14]|uniref:YybH family protein n=1 Tax=Pedobacter sp. MC2016-14 TaxID=2897327 RepID=UPI001E4F61B2|nr:DUF4440 domain-containing protein [Pedobacter sp. MC2016-14]MCD0490206.1 DUF4440 domain-containing protein [Pedobacter sp. MC2016-14]
MPIIENDNLFKEEILRIEKARLDSNACILKKDVNGVAKYWTPDFVQVAGDGSYSKGKDRIAKDWKYMFTHSSPVFERIPDEISIAESGDMAWEKGKWAYKTDKYYGNYAAMWRKIKGQWLTQTELYVAMNA